MRTWHTFLLAGIAVVLAGVSAIASAQQMTIRTPFRTASDSFFEQQQISWSGNWKGITFSYGGGALAVPPFGGADPSAGLSANFGFADKNGQINFATNFGSGYRQSFTTQTPSVTIMNGQTGYISDTSQTPFVISVIPVVGAFPVTPQTLPPLPPPVTMDDLTGVDPRIEAMAQARADARAQAGAQAAAQAGHRAAGRQVVPCNRCRPSSGPMPWPHGRNRPRPPIQRPCAPIRAMRPPHGSTLPSRAPPVVRRRAWPRRSACTNRSRQPPTRRWPP